MNQRILIGLIAAVSIATSCRKDGEDPLPPVTPGSVGTPYVVELPGYVPPMLIPADNPLTEEGVRLGRFLFYEERLSGDNTMSCASCHAPALAFADGQAVSVGIDGIAGTRSSMPLFNLGFSQRFFWDARATNLEQQALEPVPNPIEMHQDWPGAVVKLQNDPAYPALFAAAFGSDQITPTRTTKALAQFMRTLVSFTSRYDRFKRGEIILDMNEALGLLMFQQEGGPPGMQIPLAGGGFVVGQGGADCFHCHTDAAALFTDDQVRNNALDPEPFADAGLGAITGDAMDNGKFKTPSLRNIMLTAPYMHDGRFATIEEVIEHYNNGGHGSSTVDAFMKFTDPDMSMELTPAKKLQIKAFLETLTDLEFINDPRHQDPGPPVF